MANDNRAVTTAMQGGGFYNRNSNLQAAGIQLALPYLEQAARSIPLGDGEPAVIADYGSSQGRNSMRPIGLAIDALRERAPGRIIEVIHTDQPSNDFSALFAALDEPGSYLAGQAGIFPSAVGRSFFEQILPPSHIHLGWSSWALHWMSSNPMDVPDHVLPELSASAAVREAMDAQLDKDWRRFLVARSAEMRAGAKIVGVFLGREGENHGFEFICGEFWQALAEMAREGLLTQQELLRITFPVAGRSVAGLQAPFADGPFLGLSLEHVSVVEAPDPFWDQYCETGDAQELGRNWAGMIRAVFGPIIVAGLDKSQNKEALLDDLFARYTARIAASPQRNQYYAAIVVVRKSEQG